ncbi:hypothetical protein LPB136_01025 [Tenacibaculum todarodis]|uniref:DUF2851 domain-containing protein n=1 Tax=Tenacibaculum todarodis TaxID=1850252 RepID=A0A1L3JFX8_9FLAO|nr:DUF2851 family protein [Tenacibaculum todarodis]APG64037.1 hypothetical protein LPB136_01025 [Tenacibaculum todarodis]
MKEDFLHYVWRYKLIASAEIETTKNEEIEILNPGVYNTNSGPDFLNTQLKINKQLWVGNVEIHLNSSDWYLHKHEEDVNYDAVILHVVWQHDVEVFMKDNSPIPTLELKGLIDNNLLKSYQNLFSKQQRWIPCENQISEVDKFVVNNWLERLYFERLERKSSVIEELLNKSNSDYEAVLFQLLAKNFGLKTNAEAFLSLATSLDFSVVRKESFNAESLEALLFGQAGFLEEVAEENYQNELKKEYEYLKHKHKLSPIANRQFQFFRMRPNNFPTIRIAQLVSLFNKHQNLFSKLIEVTKMEDFYSLLSVEVNEFWKTHYTFETTSKKSPKKLTKSFIDLLLINTIIPLKFQYLNSRGEVDEEDFLQLIQQLKPEKNTIISKFSDLKISAKNAFESQALLELKNNYCAPKQCLQCAIGKTILKK